MTHTVTSSIFEIKVNNKWIMVRATGMKALNDYCQQNGITKWRMVGMISISELSASQSLTVIA